jgi:hypothetical protein
MRERQRERVRESKLRGGLPSLRVEIGLCVCVRERERERERERAREREEGGLALVARRARAA